MKYGDGGAEDVVDSRDELLGPRLEIRVPRVQGDELPGGHQPAFENVPFPDVDDPWGRQHLDESYVDGPNGVGVVVEVDTTHPLSKLNTAWQHFWDLERPKGPTVADLLEVLADIGIRPQVDIVDIPDHKDRIGRADVERTRIRLCLSEDRDGEIRRFLETEERPGRQLATIWWER